ncbi:hypothetical protein MMC08_008263 [Hypocenomyce scalaris]|nr:hypothetical protein [Hypocenomyce scalaris]
MASTNGTTSAGQRLSDPTPTCKKCTNGNKVTVDFPDGTFTFHSQWLHDARCDDGAARNATTAICQQSIATVHVETVQVSGQGGKTTLDVTWDDGLSSKFPIPWLRVMASLVAARSDRAQPARKRAITNGWTVDTLKIPEVSFNDLFREGIKQEQLDATILSIIDRILSSSSPGIVKIIHLPNPNLEDERNHINNLNTLVLKRLFGSVFIHPIRGSDQTFNVSSHAHDSTRKVGLPNYDTTQLLLPHSDHAFYDNPIQVQGFYGLEGESENTWVSVLAALETFKREAPESYHHLCNAPMAVGRVSRFYGDPLYQATVDTAITMQPGAPDQVKRVRWHPNLTGSLLSPYDEYKEARLAHQKFQEIIRRDTHQLKLILKPGDLYIWDNFRLLHGREKVLEVPRTGVGQTVPEQVVHDRYRALSIGMLKGLVGEEWLIHLPMPQLREMVRIVKDENY